MNRTNLELWLFHTTPSFKTLNSKTVLYYSKTLLFVISLAVLFNTFDIPVAKAQSFDSTAVQDLSSPIALPTINKTKDFCRLYCGLYGECELEYQNNRTVRQHCKCEPSYRGIRCEDRVATDSQIQAYDLLNTFLTFVYIIGFTLLCIQISYRIKRKSLHLNVSDATYIVLILFSSTRAIYHATRSLDNTRFDFLPLFRMFLNILGGDLMLTAFSILIISWIEVVHEATRKSDKSGLGWIDRLRPFLLCINIAIYSWEVAAMLSVLVYKRVNPIYYMYWKIYSFEILVVGIFNVVYGIRLNRIFSVVERYQSRTRAMTTYAVTTGLCAVIGFTVFLAYWLTEFDHKIEGVISSLAITRLLEVIGVSLLFYTLKGEKFKRSLNIRNWFDQSKDISSTL